ncbi:hypothetical protein COV12_00140 [Candidatus Woesearchaeota archaeon CG10_big_fil_rev_8_21_14_0_10_32_24]|nr:MAG: hypothetical protein COV12_00140 [Candidatus Woesearchaeota archaeon CG10_big_fil_rev_8_21_14_0_10_32_24]
MVINRRLTLQRKIILEYLQNVKTHPTAEEVFNNVKIKIPKITLATIYRNLQILAKEKQAERLEVNGQFHFDGDLDPHIHFICKNCQIIKDLFYDDLVHYFEKKMETSGFSIKNFKIQCEGICKNCTQEA